MEASCPSAVAMTYVLEARPQPTTRVIGSTRIISLSRLNECVYNKPMAIKLALYRFDDGSLTRVGWQSPRS